MLRKIVQQKKCDHHKHTERGSKESHPVVNKKSKWQACNVYQSKMSQSFFLLSSSPLLIPRKVSFIWLQVQPEALLGWHLVSSLSRSCSFSNYHYNKMVLAPLLVPKVLKRSRGGLSMYILQLFLRNFVQRGKDAILCVLERLKHCNKNNKK